jgi:hypothetical protein
LNGGGSSPFYLGGRALHASIDKAAFTGEIIKKRADNVIGLVNSPAAGGQRGSAII